MVNDVLRQFDRGNLPGSTAWNPLVVLASIWVDRRRAYREERSGCRPESALQPVYCLGVVSEMREPVIPFEDPMETSSGAIGERLHSVLLHQGFYVNISLGAVRLDVQYARGWSEDEPDIKQTCREILDKFVNVVGCCYVPSIVLWGLGAKRGVGDSDSMPTEVGGSADARQAILNWVHAIVDLSGVSKIIQGYSGRIEPWFL